MTYTQSVDGFGDRDDIALERSRSEGTKTDNYYSQFHRPIASAEYSKDGFSLKDIFIKMLKKNSMRALYFKEQIAPCEDIKEAFSDAWCALISEMDLDDEESYHPSIQDQGHQVEITLQ